MKSKAAPIMKFNQKGFSAAEGLLALVTVALIIGVSFYAVNASKDKIEDSKVTQNWSTATEGKPSEAKKQYLDLQIFTHQKRPRTSLSLLW